jgi:radical SAM protein with 4Fe4S-binding SPASM domain
MSYQIKELLSASVVKKSSKHDPEKILYDHLYPKFGERFIEYRKKYEKYLNNNKYKYEFPYPISVILELINRCNLECTMCYQGYRNDTKKYTFSEEDLEKIFLDFEKNQLDALLLSASEPLLYKKIGNVLKLAEKSKIMDIFLFTNGTLLNEQKNKILLDSNLTRLFVSLDAATNDTYQKVRIPVSKNVQNINRLNMIENNIKNFIKMRNEMGKQLPLVRVSFVALKDNSHEINKFIDKWINVVDSVEIQKENSIKLYDTIHKLKDQNLDGKVIFKKKEYHCNEPWGQVTINSDGSVGPCCNTVGRNIEIGNVLKNNLKDIWRGNEMNKIRNGFKSNDPNQICKLCLEHEQINY